MYYFQQTDKWQITIINKGDKNVVRISKQMKQNWNKLKEYMS